MAPTEHGIKEGRLDREVLEELKAALLAVDARVIWELYDENAWYNPDADVCNMIGHIDGFLTENADSLPVVE